MLFTKRDLITTVFHNKTPKTSALKVPNYVYILERDFKGVEPGFGHYTGETMPYRPIPPGGVLDPFKTLADTLNPGSLTFYQSANYRATNFVVAVLVKPLPYQQLSVEMFVVKDSENGSEIQCVVSLRVAFTVEFDEVPFIAYPEDLPDTLAEMLKLAFDGK